LPDRPIVVRPQQSLALQDFKYMRQSRNRNAGVKTNLVDTL